MNLLSRDLQNMRMNFHPLGERVAFLLAVRDEGAKGPLQMLPGIWAELRAFSSLSAFPGLCRARISSPK